MAPSLMSSLLLLVLLSCIVFIATAEQDEIDEEKRARNPYSWMADRVDKRSRNPYSWMAEGKRARNPYSWMQFEKRARNPYSWMEQ